jgi:hypothetical protein
MDVASLIYIPLSDNLQSPLSNTPFSPLLPPNRYLDGHPNGHLDEYSNGNIDYLNNKLNGNAIKTLQPSSNKPSPIYN